jgi:hypothetical protein
MAVCALSRETHTYFAAPSLLLVAFSCPHFSTHRVSARELYFLLAHAQPPWRLSLHCVSLLFTAFHCASLRFTAFHCVSLRFSAFHCVSLRCVALRCLALPCVSLRCVALRCVALRCLALRCVALDAMGCPPARPPAPRKTDKREIEISCKGATLGPGTEDCVNSSRSVNRRQKC